MEERKEKGASGVWWAGFHFLRVWRCVALVTAEDRLWCISRRDRVPSLGMTGRIRASTGSSDLVPSSLGLRWASFDLEARILFPYGVYKEEGEGAHRLVVSMNLSSSWSSEPSLRTPRRGCDTITFLYVLQALIWSDVVVSLSEGFLRVHLILLANARRMVASVRPPWSCGERNRRRCSRSKGYDFQ